MSHIISHIYKDSDGHYVIQSNEEHLAGVAELASNFTSKITKLMDSILTIIGWKRY